MKKISAKIFRIFLYAFAAIGLLFTLVFIGMQLNLFTVRGSIASRNQFFVGGTPAAKTLLPVSTPPCSDPAKKVCDWNETHEWSAIEGGFQKDAAKIQKVSAETGVSSRMIAAVVLPEQTRFFTANRDVFKRYFEPLKILGTLSQFSLGVSGIKQTTATQIETYANDPSSPFYPGSDIAALIAYAPGTDHDTELFSRLTDAKDHYYQYLYTAIFIKEIESQWGREGFDISGRPEIIATLFNIGFAASHPNADPKAAGAPITTGGQTYAYGELGSLFYHSDALTNLFPLNPPTP